MLASGRIEAGLKNGQNANTNRETDVALLTSERTLTKSGITARALGGVGVFAMSMLLMAFACIWAWDAFVNGKLYYCTDGGTIDFIFVGDWVHHPESVSQIVPRSMSQPDEIKAGWTITGLWCLWCAFVAGSVFVSMLFAGALWRASSPRPAAVPVTG